jgi:hypothetical protein
MLNRFFLLAGFGCTICVVPANAAADGRHVSEMQAAAKEAYEWHYALWQIGAGDPESVYRWSVRWMDAEVSDAVRPIECMAAASAHLQRMECLYARVKLIHDKSSGSSDPVAAVRYYVAEAKRRLAQYSGTTPGCPITMRVCPTQGAAGHQFSRRRRRR